MELIYHFPCLNFMSKPGIFCILYGIAAFELNVLAVQNKKPL
jgi:hypothetical protein